MLPMWRDHKQRQPTALNQYRPSVPLLLLQSKCVGEVIHTTYSMTAVREWTSEERNLQTGLDMKQDREKSIILLFIIKDL